MNNVPLEPGVPASRGESRYLKVNEMKQVQRGFTLIELVMVIVILGVLAAVAIPKFVDLKGDAQVAAVQGVAGGISSASSVNYAAKSVNSAKGATTTGLTCTAAATAILQGGLPAGYTLAAVNIGAVGVSTDCIVTNTAGSQTATATIIGI
jgi:prepilin-type N-terminal cleavage/methylation domain-containing protein